MSRNDRKRGGVKKHLSLAEAAERMDISERTARRWIKSGKLRAYKPGRDYWIPESALTELVEESEVHPKASASSQPSFNGLLEEERRLAKREKLIDALPGWTRAAVEDEEFVQRFEAAKSSPARAKDLRIRQGEEADRIIAQLRDLKERDAPPAELKAARRDLAQTRARETVCTFMEVDLWRNYDVADVRPVDILAEVAAARHDIVAALTDEGGDVTSEAG
jgi:excisionase family DNA binding protein